jgi:hypothetical protein
MGGITLDDPVARTWADLTFKTGQDATILLPSVKPQELSDAIGQLVSKDVMMEAKALGSIDPEKPTANPALAAFEKARERVNSTFDPKQIKTVDDYVKALSEQFHTGLNQVKKQKQAMFHHEGAILAQAGMKLSDAKSHGAAITGFFKPPTQNTII